MLTWNLTRNRTADLGLGVLQKLYESGNKVPVDHLFIDGFGNLAQVSLSHVLDAFVSAYLLESICDHVSHSPALILEQTPQGGQKHAVTRLLLLGHCLRNRDEDVDCQKPDAILVVGREMLEKRNHLVDDNGCGHGLDELGEIVRRLSADHGGVIVHQLAVVLSECFLRRWCGARVWCLVQASRGDLRCEPIGFGEAHNKGDEGILNLLLRQLFADLVQGLDSLHVSDFGGFQR
jgi:hypothetical protein